MSCVYIESFRSFQPHARRTRPCRPARWRSARYAIRSSTATANAMREGSEDLVGRAIPSHPVRCHHPAPSPGSSPPPIKPFHRTLTPDRERGYRTGCLILSRASQPSARRLRRGGSISISISPRPSGESGDLPVRACPFFLAPFNFAARARLTGTGKLQRGQLPVGRSGLARKGTAIGCGVWRFDGRGGVD
jgi:hypothetical protein